MIDSILSTISALLLAISGLLGIGVEAPVQNPIVEETPAYVEVVDSYESYDEMIDDVVEEKLGAFNPSGGASYRLKASIGSTNTTIPLSSFKEPISNILYTMSYLNSTIGYGTVDPQTTRSEFVSFSGITQNSDGSATLTGVTRGLTRTPAGSSCTASTTLANPHPGQSIFILSDSPCFFTEYPVKRNDETISGQWSWPEPSAASSTATKNYVDTVVSGGTFTTSKVTVTATAGETLSAGQLIYQKSSDGEWYKVDLDNTNTITDALLGIAQGSGTDGVSISGGALVKGLDTNQSGLTIGSNYFPSTTAGGITTATSTNFKAIGKARTATNLYFDPTFIDTLKPLLGVDQTFTGQNTFSSTSTFSGAMAVTGTSTFSNQVNGQIKNTQYFTASTTFTGATTPQPVHVSSGTSTAYLADANDKNLLNFIGFAKNSVVDGNTVFVQTDGIVSGFTGLTVGSKYYVQDAIGTIGNSPGTEEIMVGVAVSTTEIMIQKGRRHASGVLSFSASASTVINTGFKITNIRIHAAVATGGAVGTSNGGWTINGSNDCSYSTTDAASASASNTRTDRAWYAYQDGTGATTGHNGTVTSIGDSGFTLSNTKEGSGANVQIFWEAEGEI